MAAGDWALLDRRRPLCHSSLMTTASHPNAAAAVMKAKAFSRKPGHVGALAFSRSGATGDFEHAKLIRKFGEVPDDLSAL
jgi:hypothetical protein